MTNADTVIAYTTTGSVRGSCGHVHRTFEAAEACIDRDAASIRAAYPSTFPTQAYSDRRVVEITQAEALTMDRIPWALLVEAGADLEAIATEAALYGDEDLARKAKAAIRRYQD